MSSAIPMSGVFNGFVHKCGKDGELQPTKEKVDFREWGEIYRLYRLGVELGLQSHPERPPQEVS